MRWPLRFRRFSAVQLLIALVAFFICAPFVEEIKGGDLIVSALFSLVLVAGVLAVAERKRTLIIAIVLAFPAIVGRWISHPKGGRSEGSSRVGWSTTWLSGL